jgi:hypothetical protein
MDKETLRMQKLAGIITESQYNEKMDGNEDEILFRDFTKGDLEFVQNQEKELETDELKYLFLDTYPSMEDATTNGEEDYKYVEKNGKIFSFFPATK